MRATCLLGLLALGACSVGDRYLIAPETLASIESLPEEVRQRTAAPAQRQKTGQGAYVRASAFSLREAKPRRDGAIAIPTRMRSRRVQLGHALVWIGTPISIAGLCMTIWGRDAARWSGIALAAVAEPVMIAGTVVWIQGAQAHPQELPRGLPELSYLPDPAVPPSPAPGSGR